MIDLEKGIVRVSWRYPFSREMVFAAIAAGKLHAVVGGRMHLNQFEFKVGGRFRSHWSDDGWVEGTFLEIAPCDKVSFTWAENRPHPPGKVTLTLSAQGNFTLVEIEHEQSGGGDQMHGYHVGWTECLALLRDELDGTTLRLERDFDVDQETLFQAIARGALFAHNGADVARGKMSFTPGGEYQFSLGAMDFIQGRFISIVSHVHLTFTWTTKEPVPSGETTVNISLRALSPTRTRLFVVHDGFVDKTSSRSHLEGWGEGLEAFAQSLTAPSENH